MGAIQWLYGGHQILTCLNKFNSSYCTKKPGCKRTIESYIKSRKRLFEGHEKIINIISGLVFGNTLRESPKERRKNTFFLPSGFTARVREAPCKDFRCSTGILP